MSSSNFRSSPPATEPTPWITGLIVSGFSALVTFVAVSALAIAFGESNQWLAIGAIIVVNVGLAPSMWLVKRMLVWRWVAFGAAGGLILGWFSLLSVLIGN